MTGNLRRKRNSSGLISMLSKLSSLPSWRIFMPIDEPPNDLTALMTLDPLDLTKQDLDKIIAYQRKQRLAREGGAKTKRATSDAPAVDIKALLGRIQKPAPTNLFPTETNKDRPGIKPTAPTKGFIRRF